MFFLIFFIWPLPVTLMRVHAGGNQDCKCTCHLHLSWTFAYPGHQTIRKSETYLYDHSLTTIKSKYISHILLRAKALAAPDHLNIPFLHD